MPIKDPEKRKQYAREYNERWRKHIRQIIDTAKNAPCADCNGSWPSYVMDFHHVNEDKEFNLAKAVQSAGPTRLSKVQAEIDKCVLLCANCHRLRHMG